MAASRWGARRDDYITRRHSLIAGNVYRRVWPLARQRGCEAHIADMFVVNPSDDHFMAVSDVFVRCGPASETTRKIDDAVIVVEVLSPSTMADDRGYKFKQYARTPSVQQILFVYQDEPRIESWTRQGSEWMLTTLNGKSGTVALPPLDGEMSVTDVYELVF